MAVESQAERSPEVGVPATPVTVDVRLDRIALREQRRPIGNHHDPITPCEPMLEDGLASCI